jgi:HSP20 family protein
LLDNFFSDAVPTYANPAFAADNRWAQFKVKATDDGFAVEAELAGVKKEDLKIEVLGDTLKISGFRGSKEEKDGFLEYGEFTKTFSLASDIDSEKIEARFENGYLNLKIPRATHKKVKLIDVK